MPQLDVLYMTRVQKERFFNEEDYLRLKDSYILTPGQTQDRQAGPHHHASAAPRQRDQRGRGPDPRACYFKQALYGKFMREALILKLLEVD